MARIGSTRSMAVLYLIPVFGVLWGALFLGETVTVAMAGGCVVILLGVALTTGMLRFAAPGNTISARSGRAGLIVNRL